MRSGLRAVKTTIVSGSVMATPSGYGASVHHDKSVIATLYEKYKSIAPSCRRSSGTHDADVAISDDTGLSRRATVRELGHHLAGRRPMTDMGATA
jgi:hypothetical protein